MEIKFHQSGQNVQLSHPYGGPQSLDLSPRLRSIRITPEELELFLAVTTAKARLTAQAAQFSATKLRDDLELAKAAIAGDEVTDEALANIARLAALATDPSVARAVEHEAHAAIAPALAAEDAKLIPTCLRLITELRAGIDKTAGKFQIQPLAEFVEDDQLHQIGAFVQDRIQATFRQLDRWVTKSNSQGAEAFLRDDAAVKIC